jgi:hypothetical protein
MSIESKIAEILEESKLAGLVLEDEEELDEELDEESVDEACDYEMKEKTNKMKESHMKMKESPMKMKEASMKMKESVDVQEDVDALLFGENLSEEFRTKATTIFEAAVISRVREEAVKLEEEFEEKLAEQVDSITEGLVEKIDGYLDYVVEQWIEQNEIALESGIKSDIMESFITGMKGLFEEHYIDVPDEKYDMIGEMETKIDALEEKLDEQVSKNIDLKKSLSEATRKDIVKMVSEGLTVTETEKFSDLVEELSFESEETFQTKVQTIRENYFTGKVHSSVQSVVTDSPVEELYEESKQVIDPAMAIYLEALKKHNT